MKTKDFKEGLHDSEDFPVISHSAYAVIYVKKERYDKAIAALREIDKWWDASDPTRVVPAKEMVAEPFYARNDSMAAGSIITAKMILKELDQDDIS